MTRMATEGSILIRKKTRQARALLAAGRLQEARDLYLQLSDLDPAQADHWAMAGVIMGRLGQLNEAASCLQQAVARRPEFAEAHYNLGKAWKGLGRPELAVASYEAALRLRPDWAEARYNLGNVFEQLGRLTEAAACHRQVLAVNPDYLPARKALGSVLMSMGELDESLACFKKLESQAPGSLDARIGMAKVLERGGDIDQASAIARQLVEAGTRNIELDLLYASMIDTPAAIALLEPWLAREHQGLEMRLRATLHFRLGALHERQKDYARSFEHYRTANSLTGGRYDLPGFSLFVDDLVSAFSRDFMSSAPRATHGSRRPIFIIGMPRSGTTLVEQILSSHPDVFGAGELDEIRHISLEMLNTDDSGRLIAGCLGDLSVDDCNRHAARYLDHLAGLANDSAHVTDKMPQNFIGLGVIALLFPEARIIHCRRDPVDTCLSCYINDFGAGHDYATDLETLGGYFRQYQRLMHHWKAVLDIPMLEIDYEALVSDQESTTRTLLGYCELAWNEQCLRFHENPRVASTSSYDQVRRPMYSRSVGRWKHYETQLKPLVDALEIG